MTRSIQFSNQLSIRRDPEDVFEFVADFSQVPTWNYAIRSTQQVTPGPVGLGSTFRQVRSIPAVAEEEFEVTAWKPGRRVAITGDFGPFSGTLTYQVEPASAGTLLTNDVELSPRGVLGRRREDRRPTGEGRDRAEPRGPSERTRVGLTGRAVGQATRGWTVGDRALARSQPASVHRTVAALRGPLVSSSTAVAVSKSIAPNQPLVTV